MRKQVIDLEVGDVIVDVRPEYVVLELIESVDQGMYMVVCDRRVGDLAPRQIAFSVAASTEFDVLPTQEEALLQAARNAVESHDNWRDCSDTRESLKVWTETADALRTALLEIDKGKEQP
jgi:hypothetical protein